jgi:small-conductance mechanosensitive channel
MMVQMLFRELFQFFDGIPPEILNVVYTLLVLASLLVIYKTLSRFLSRTSRRLELDAHMQNSFRLLLRVVMLLVGLAAVFSVYALPAEWLIGASALMGAAIGFGSSQTINNIVAGFYVVVSRPFKVKDYVKIGDVEGQVEEISINYTKLYTPSFNLLLLPNTQVMNSRILNCTHEGFIKYTFSLSLPHSAPLSNEEIYEKCMRPAVEEFYRKYKDKQLRIPEYYFEASAHFGRSFKIRIFIPKGEVKTLYTLQSELSDMIMNRWDAERTSKSPTISRS